MTIKELYEWAKETNRLDYDIDIEDCTYNPECYTCNDDNKDKDKYPELVLCVDNESKIVVMW